MNKKIKKIIALAAFTGTAMYACNKYIDYFINHNRKTLSKNENYFLWREGNIYYKKKGTGAPLLLIHDLNPIASSLEWSKVINQLSQTHTVYAIDLLGCGKSDKPAITYVNYLYVQLIRDFIDHVIGQKTDLVATGESFTFAVMAARMNPEKIKSITAINPTDTTHNVQSPDSTSRMKKSILELPLTGTFIYNMIATRRMIKKEFCDYYYYNERRVSYTLPEHYHELAHLQNSNGKYLYASMLGNYTNINIIHALKLISQPVHFILTDAASEEVYDYKKYNETLTIDYIKDAGYLPQLEMSKKVCEIINARL